jgi:hypothetical protein
MTKQLTLVWIKTNDCKRTKPEKCDWNIRTEDGFKVDEAIKIKCGCT